jgi:hypothetical protein
LLVSEIRGYSIANFRMTSDAIVEHLDVFKDHLPSMLTVGKAVVMRAFRLERTKIASRLNSAVKIRRGMRFMDSPNKLIK